MNPQQTDNTTQNISPSAATDIAKIKISSYLDLVEFIEIMKEKLSAGQITYEYAKKQIEDAKLRFDANINGL